MSLDCSKQYLAKCETCKTILLLNASSKFGILNNKKYYKCEKCDNLCEAHLIGGLYIFNERKRQTYIPQPYDPKDSDHQ